MLEQQGVNRFADVAYDTVAAIVNDLCCVGALPLVVNAYFATGSSDWYREPERARGAAGGVAPRLRRRRLRMGRRRVAVAAGARRRSATSSSPARPSARFRAGARRCWASELSPGDEIVLVASSGLHANGASLARLLAARLPDGYATALASGRRSARRCSTPSLMYAPLVAALLERGLRLTYISHMTGHGLLKLMRPPAELTYRDRAAAARCRRC